VISVTGPILGVIIGGNITASLGGYTAEKPMRVCMFFAVLCFCCSAPICFLNDFAPVAVLLWFLLFFGGAILPAMTGIMLSCVEQSQKTTANSIANLCYNLGGFMPGPFIYGLILDAYKGDTNKTDPKIGVNYCEIKPMPEICVGSSTAELIHDNWILNGSKVAMGALMFSPIISVSTLFLAARLIYRDNVLNYYPDRPIGKQTKAKVAK